MEHLGIDTSKYPLLCIPLYHHDDVGPYNYSGFPNYLATKGWSQDTFIEAFETTTPSYPSTALLCLLQNYCYFALLHSFFDRFKVAFKLEEFVRRDNNTAWISTHCLEEKASQVAFSRAAEVIQLDQGTAVFLTIENLQSAPVSMLASIGGFSMHPTQNCEAVRSLAAELNTATKVLQGIMNRLHLRNARLLQFKDPDYSLIFSCQVLIETLRGLVDEVYPPQPPSTFNQNFTPSSAYETFARLNNWCPNRIGRDPADPCISAMLISMQSKDDSLHGPDMADLMSLPEHEYLLEENQAQITNRLYSDVVNGNPPVCREDRCLMKDTEGDMRPRHRCLEDSSCQWLGFDQARLAAIYTSGTYPLLSFQMEKDQLSIDIVEYVDGLQYCALSHVWSHGLGNASDTKLPCCQLEFLYELADRALPHSLIWIDSICVPVDCKYEESRKRAIQMMARVYQNSTKTIVLDKALEHTALHPTRIGLEMLWSDWSHRLWTLQEAILPGPAKLVVFVGGTLVPWNEIANSHRDVQYECVKWILENCAKQGIDIKQSFDPSLLNLMERYVLGKILSNNIHSTRPGPVKQIWNPLERDVWGRLETSLSPPGHSSEPDCLRKISAMFCSRAASVPTDEFICIAQLLGHDLKDFPTLPTSMKPIIERTAIFNNIVFLPGPRIACEGFRWCPASLLSQDSVSAQLSPDIEPAERTREGLLFQKSAWIGHKSIQLTVGKNFVLTEDTIPKALTVWTEQLKYPNETLKVSGSVLIQRPAFLLLFDVENPERRHSRTVSAVLVDIAPTSDRSMERARFIVPLLLTRMDVENAEPFHPEDDHFAERIPVTYAKDHKWLID